MALAADPPTLFFLAWLASGLSLGFDVRLALALHRLLPGGNLALLCRIRRQQRREIAALHRQIERSHGGPE